MLTWRTILGATILSGSLAAAGCGENKAVKAAREMADAVCACKDVACAQKAASDGTDRLLKVAETARGTESDAKKIEAQTERSTKCLRALASAQ